jgi:hypothetical protein
MWRVVAIAAPLAFLIALPMSCGLSTQGELGVSPEGGGSPGRPDGSGGGLPDSVVFPDSAHRGDASGSPHDAQAHADVVADARGMDVAADTKPPFYPTSCTEADAGADATMTLYVGGDPAKSWTAVCLGSSAYLPLTGTNVSSYPAGGCATVPSGSGSSVSTTWSMVRIDESTLLVDTSDYTGSVSTGMTMEVSGSGSVMNNYASMPFASARSCDDAMHNTAFGNVDLTGTGFTVLTTQKWYLLGFSNTGGPYGAATLDGTDQKVAITTGGYPAGNSPCNDYYTNTGGKCLQLVYGP